MPRQRRAIRIVQILLVLLAAGLLIFAGYSWGRSTGFDQAREADGFGAPRKPGIAQVVVLGALGALCIGGALLLQGEGVRIPVPSRLDDLAHRAEAAAMERAADAATAPKEQSSSR